MARGELDDAARAFRERPLTRDRGAAVLRADDAPAVIRGLLRDRDATGGGERTDRAFAEFLALLD